MSLFDDDFFSTKVSRRVKREEQPSANGIPMRWRSRGVTLPAQWRLVLIASLSSAVVVGLFFTVLIYGFGGLKPSKEPVSIADLSKRTVQASAKVRPAVVSIINEQSMFTTSGQGKDGGNSAPSLQEASVGSGVIIDKRDGKAIIVTNYHVIDRAQRVQAVLMNGEKREAVVLGKDQLTDLAVLSMDGKGIETVAEIGDSSELHAAEFVVTIGNPLGFGDSVSFGVISNTLQIVPVSLSQNGVYDWEQEVIQIDASINQGNSGGPLIDLEGRVIGINSMKIASFGVEGIGFAIPINSAMPVIESLLQDGQVIRPYLGVYMMDLQQYWEQKAMEEMMGENWWQSGNSDSEEENIEEESSQPPSKEPGIQDEAGEVIEEQEWNEEHESSTKLSLPDEVFQGVIVLEATGPALQAGLQYNDVIVKLDKVSVGSIMDLRKYLYGKKSIGDKMEITYYRGSERKTVTLALSSSDQAQQ